jgi:hypothetical protein
MRLDQIKQLSAILLIASNLLPIVGVLQWNWDVATIMILYWSENLIIGAFTIVKMISQSPVLGLLNSAFFALHYGGFCGMHGLFLLTLVAHTTAPISHDWPFVLVFAEILFNVVHKVIEIATPDWLLGFAALFISHGVSLVQNYFIGGERTQVSDKDLMTSPYKRIMVLHIAIIAGGMGVMALGSPLPLLLVLIAGKILLDLHAHLREHSQRSSSLSLGTPPPLQAD